MSKYKTRSGKDNSKRESSFPANDVFSVKASNDPGDAGDAEPEPRRETPQQRPRRFSADGPVGRPNQIIVSSKSSAVSRVSSAVAIEPDVARRDACRSAITSNTFRAVRPLPNVPSLGIRSK
jgi:hypothetical protein